MNAKLHSRRRRPSVTVGDVVAWVGFVLIVTMIILALCAAAWVAWPTP